jgi:hypothetical protein
MPFFSRFLNQFSNQSCVGNWLSECFVTTEGLQAKGRSLFRPQAVFDAEDSAVTARDSGADLDLSPRDGVSVLRESVSKVSVVPMGSKRARMRASGLFRIPVTMATMLAMVVVMMVGAASAVAAGAGPGWAIDSVALPTSFSPGGEGTIQRNSLVCSAIAIR